MSSRKQCEPFEVTYIGDPFDFVGGPPKGAKLVADVSWGWAPGHDRAERYLICTDPKRSGWTLWAKACDECSGRLMYSKLAWGGPYRGHSTKWAAEQLLAVAWSGEEATCQTLRGAHVDQEGLLTKGDVARIEHEVFGE